MAARVSLLRGELIGRIENSLRPLFWGQMFQMLIGILRSGGLLGCIGLGISLVLFRKTLRSDLPWDQKLTRSLAGESLGRAEHALHDLAEMDRS